MKPTSPPAAVEGPVAIVGDVPDELGQWVGLFQRAVYREWILPGGIPLDDPQYVPEVYITVSRDGRILDGPMVSKKTPSDDFDISCVNAILNATIPPFSDAAKVSELTLVVRFQPLARAASGP